MGPRTFERDPLFRPFDIFSAAIVSLVLRLAAALLLFAGCDRGSTPASLAPDKPVSAKPKPKKERPEKISRAAALGVGCRCPIDIAVEAETEGGEVVAYTYKRMDAAIGEAESRGHDVHAQLRSAEEACRQEREAWSQEQLEAYFQGDGITCELAANQQILGDVGLTPDCKALGLAYFTNAGELLEQNEIGTRCAKSLDTLRVTELAEGAGPQVLLVFGETAGREEEEHVTTLRIFALERDGSYLVDTFDTTLSEHVDADGCSTGVERTHEFDTDGNITIVATPWSTCPDRCQAQSERCEEPSQTTRVMWDGGYSISSVKDTQVPPPS